MWAVTNRFVESRDEIKERIVENRWEWPDDLRMGRMNNEPYQSYDTSFEIVKLDAFRREDIREWYKEVTDDINFIYKYRWGKPSSASFTVLLLLTTVVRLRSNTILDSKYVLRCKERCRGVLRGAILP